MKDVTIIFYFRSKALLVFLQQRLIKLHIQAPIKLRINGRIPNITTLRQNVEISRENTSDLASMQSKEKKVSYELLINEKLFNASCTYYGQFKSKSFTIIIAQKQFVNILIKTVYGLFLLLLLKIELLIVKKSKILL